MSEHLYDIPAALSGMFEGEVRLHILEILSARSEPMESTDLVDIVLGEPNDARRAVMRNTIKAMRPKLRQRGYDIHGRTELRRNAYQLINTALE